MKKILLSAFAIGASLLCGSAATTFEVDGVTYEVTSAGEVAVSDVQSTLTSVNIPEEVTDGNDTYAVTSIGTYAFNWSKVVEVTLPNSVTSLEYAAFYNSSLATVHFGTGLKSIGDYAFGYTSLADVAVPEGVSFIGNSAFFRCDNLAHISLPESLRTIDASAFYKCPLTEVVIPQGVETIGKSAFLFCGKLTSITLPDGLQTIGESTFQGCTSLSAITLPSALVTIGDNAFLDCPFTSITLPAAVANIGGAAFGGTRIATFEVDPANKNLTSVDGILYNADKSLLLACPPAYAQSSVTTTAECLGISYGAFDRCQVSEVILGDKVRALDAMAFVQSNLSSINFPESLVYIGEQALAGTRLTNVVLPKNLAIIQNAALAGIETLTSVTIPAKATYIANRAFWDCKALTTVNFAGMTPPKLEDFYDVDEAPFFNVPSSCKVNIPAGTLPAYKTALAGSFTESQLQETLPAALVPTATNPENKAEVSTFEGVTLTFSEAVTPVSTRPSVSVIKGRLVAGVPVGDKVSVDGWMVSSSSTATPFIFPADWDGYTAPFNMENGSDYFLTIAAGAFKNASGELSEEITLQFTGTYVKPEVKFLSAEPEDGSTIDEIGRFVLTFQESVNLQLMKMYDIKVYEGPVEDNNLIESSWMQVSGMTSGTEIGFFRCDDYGDGYSEPYPLKENTEYTVVLPAGMFRMSSSYSSTSPEITLHYNGPQAAAFEITGFDPEDGSTLDTFEYVTINFTEMAVFDEAKSKQIKAVLVPDGYDIEDGDEVRTMDFWAVPENYTTEMILFPIDMDGFTVPIEIPAGYDLHLVLPEGLFHNLSGNASTPATTLHFEGPEAEKFGITGFDPENESGLSEWQGVIISFNQWAIYNESKLDAIKAVITAKGESIEEGTAVTNYDLWGIPENYTTEMTLFPMDWDGFTCPITVPADHELYVVLPQGLFHNMDSSVETDEVTLHYTSTLDGVASVGINDADIVIETVAGGIRVVADKFCIYTTSGTTVATGEGDTTTALVPGIYTVRATTLSGGLRCAKVAVK